MKTKDLIKLMQSEFDSGESLHTIYEKNKNDGIKEKKLAYLVGSLKDASLIKQYKTPNNVLIGAMAIITIISAFAGYYIGLEVTPDTAIYWSAIAIIPMMFLYGFIKMNYQAYLAYLALTISQFPKLFTNFGADPVFDITGLVVSISVIGLVFYLKINLFPYMSFFGAKKNDNKEYLVALNS